MDIVIGFIFVLLLLFFVYWIGYSRGYDDRHLKEHDEWIGHKIKKMSEHERREDMFRLEQKLYKIESENLSRRK